MDYLKHYNLLITRANSRTLEGYTEKHHIIPKCMGGTDDVKNLVILTGAEHYIAHQLLCKMHPTNHKLAHALKILMGSRNYNNKQFEWVRKKAVETSKIFHTGRKRSKETSDNISKAMKGKRKGIKFSESHKQKLSEALKGRKLSEEHKLALSNRIITDEWRKKLSIANINRDWTGHSEKIKLGITLEARKKLSNLRKNAIKKSCPYCFKEVDIANFSRWHGDKCKEKSNGL
ncbi:phage-associated homing endonuclease [Yersinia phage phiR1-RT]|uniref:Phage-associated homing endonuclease n=1 Tax=Yersinia phage phiR1-RT TaxID=1206558 RepID=I7LEM7_BPPR1|nr:homing endonuclease [Yersinia phage phiR1-RT]CCI88722.1 phage-associated homing endonuclease [Yersinia phage phiR1-RT]